jgi:hypothetical protein
VVPVNNLFKSIQDIQTNLGLIDPMLFVVVISASLLASFAASWFYRFFYENRATGSQVHRAFPLLGISITTLFVGIQLSLPLSLGLLGALSIIRFRTPIKEPEEVGFIMLVIAAAISCATLNFQFLVILYIFAIIALVATRHARLTKHYRDDGILIITLRDDLISTKLPEITRYIKRQTRQENLESTSSREGTTSLQFTIAGLKTDVATLISDIRAIVAIDSINVYFNRPGGLR